MLVTIPDAPRERLDAIVGACAEAGVDVPLRAARDRPRPARRARRAQNDRSDAGSVGHRAERSFLDRLLAVLPFAIAALALLSLASLVEAWSRKTPWIFTDELEWTQISRAIAATGHAARRGEPIYFKSLYAFVIAPFWWIHSTSAAYAAIKYANAVVMSLAAIPTYLLARMMVSRRAAAIAGLAVLCTSAFFYAGFLLPEVLAYPTFVLCAWVSVRALAGGGRWWIAGGDRAERPCDPGAQRARHAARGVRARRRRSSGWSVRAGSG